MCRSMVDIQSLTAENRRGKCEENKKKEIKEIENLNYVKHKRSISLPATTITVYVCNLVKIQLLFFFSLLLYLVLLYFVFCLICLPLAGE